MVHYTYFMSLSHKYFPLSIAWSFLNIFLNMKAYPWKGETILEIVRYTKCLCRKMHTQGKYIFLLVNGNRGGFGNDEQRQDIMTNR